ncbi:hypothetical protein HanPSC8_Chr17g0766041 [Helianthus annuus]|nr:hypothetical protein HanPSC8_Chr17g0766041 [Helianthus annuus]
MRLLMTSLKATDAKEVASSMTAVANKKLKSRERSCYWLKENRANWKLLDLLLSVYLLVQARGHCIRCEVTCMDGEVVHVAF